MAFRTQDGVIVPALTTDQMREVDRLAVEEFGLGILQMMENAGRNLALSVMDMLGKVGGDVTVLAGSGGNGGGGLCCARHLRNRGFKVQVVLDRDANGLGEAAGNQLRILAAAGLEPTSYARAEESIQRADIVVDALIGYGLRGQPRGRTAQLIELCNRHAAQVVSLDVPSGIDATTGQAPGPVAHPNRTLTLALPKVGLRSAAGELYLADIGIPPEVYDRVGVSFDFFFGSDYWIRLVPFSESQLS